jgi:hypothetical protein
LSGAIAGNSRSRRTNTTLAPRQKKNKPRAAQTNRKTERTPSVNATGWGIGRLAENYIQLANDADRYAHAEQQVVKRHGDVKEKVCSEENSERSLRHMQSVA